MTKLSNDGGAESKMKNEHPVKLLRDGGDPLLRVLGSHFVSLIVAGRFSGGELQRFAYSAFIVQIRGDWFLMTAGHVISGLKEARDRGFRIERWLACDSFGGGPERVPLILDLQLDEWVWRFDAAAPDGIDLAGTSIAEFHARGLAANGIRPVRLGDDYQRLSGRQCTQVALLGVPNQRVNFTSEPGKVTLGLRFVPLEILLNPSDVVSELSRDSDRIFGQINMNKLAECLVTDIAGMSGGPVFGFWVSDDEQTFDYTIVGIQSGWHARSGQIAAWPLDDFSANVSEAEQRARTHQAGIATS